MNKMILKISYLIISKKRKILNSHSEIDLFQKQILHERFKKYLCTLIRQQENFKYILNIYTYVMLYVYLMAQSNWLHCRM